MDEICLLCSSARPTNAGGVEVSLDTIDPNGNFMHIGNTTSDSSGAFSYQWVPEIPGKYTVIATFDRLKQLRYASNTQTAIAVDEIEKLPQQ